MPGKNGKNLKKKMNPTKGVKKITLTMKPSKMIGRKKMKKGGSLSAANDDIVSMETIFDLIRVDQMKKNQERYGS